VAGGLGALTERNTANCPLGNTSSCTQRSHSKCDMGANARAEWPDRAWRPIRRGQATGRTSRPRPGCTVNAVNLTFFHAKERIRRSLGVQHAEAKPTARADQHRVRDAGPHTFQRLSELPCYLRGARHAVGTTRNGRLLLARGAVQGARSEVRRTQPGVTTKASRPPDQASLITAPSRTRVSPFPLRHRAGPTCSSDAAPAARGSRAFRRSAARSHPARG